MRGGGGKGGRVKDSAKGKVAKEGEPGKIITRKTAMWHYNILHLKKVTSRQGPPKKGQKPEVRASGSKNGEA